MCDLLYVMLMRDISCLTVATVHFTSAQVAVIFLLCGFLLLSLTSVILVFCGLQDFLSLGNMLNWCWDPNVTPEEISFLCQKVCIVKSSH